MIYVFTDGSSLTANGIGGWAFSIVKGIEDPIQAKLPHKVGKRVAYGSGSEEKTTNNRMELTGAIHGLQKAGNSFPGSKITLVADSLYVINGCSQWRQNWERRNFRGSTGAVKNVDLWKVLFTVVDAITHLEYIHVRGHRGIYWNEHVDKMARQEADQCKDLKSLRESELGW